MFDFINALAPDAFFYAAIFGSAIMLFFSSWFIATGLYRQRRSVSRAENQNYSDLSIRLTDADVSNISKKDLVAIQRYVESNISPDKDSIANRLTQAGFYASSSYFIYNIIRICLGVVVFILTIFIISYFYPEIETSTVFLSAFVVGGLGVLIPNFYLDRRIKKLRESHRRLFPDFMDMMIVCTDAGLSIEAAANRVAQEFLVNNRNFGIQLSIMMLEVRAGRRLREALSNFALRLGIDEARSLATLFRQSEELGTSLTEALRTYSDEMRQMRILRAEEKANALPVKMILPLATFLFPVTMAIVVIPVLMKLIKLIVESAPT